MDSLVLHIEQDYIFLMRGAYMDRLKKWRWVFGIVLIVSLIICIFPWRYKINKTIQGVQCRLGDIEYSEDVSITVKGEYKRYLLKNDKFEGSITIRPYDLTYELPLFPITFTGGTGNVNYGGSIKGKLVMKHLGFISNTPDFEQLFIGVHEPIMGGENGRSSWTGENGLFICAPAENREQALKVANFLSSKSDWISLAEWIW